MIDGRKVCRVRKGMRYDFQSKDCSKMISIYFDESLWCTKTEAVVFMRLLLQKNRTRIILFTASEIHPLPRTNESYTSYFYRARQYCNKHWLEKFGKITAVVHMSTARKTGYLFDIHSLHWMEQQKGLIFVQDHLSNTPVFIEEGRG